MKEGYYFLDSNHNKYIADTNVYITFSIKADFSTVGQFQRKKYIGLMANNANNYYAINGGTQGEAITDVYDVNDNGSVSDVMLGASSNAYLTVLANDVLLMDTYLIPDGGTRQPPYDPSQPQTAVPFTP
ncbi:MAG: hypothetical protein LBG59_10120 [Candidatus Peribacteria bacterium]|jgi:hypothetical protein|nr:hypothetical protein [Candidatus Peribacteria bacterium]